MNASTATEGTRVAAFLQGLAGLEVETLRSADGTPTFGVERELLPELWKKLRDGAGFESVTFVTAVDRFPNEPRFEVRWQLLSVSHGDRVRLLTRATADDARVPSCTPLWPGASFSERECFDMFGIDFEGHPDLRRLLMPEGYEHHPLRKDFPHQGIEPDKLYRQWDAARRRDWAERERKA